MGPVGGYAGRVMTIHRVSSGCGYEYYTREVASADERLGRGEGIGDYYLKSGAPAGVWMGRSASRFNLGEEVSEQEMRDLFGEGKRPDAQRIRDAKGGVVDEGRLFLGQRMGAYSTGRERFREELNRRLDALREQCGGSAPKEEAARVRLAWGREEFVREKMRRPLNPEELSRYISAKLRPTGSAVAGFDCTFSAPKSVSVLWALGDRGLQKEVEGAHLEAVERAVGFMESDVVGSRAGRNGVHRVAADGVVAARFRHYDSRAGDPQLHDHVVVANRVFCPSGGADAGAGKWRTIDSKALYKAVVASSERYNDALMESLNRRLGVRFEVRGGDGGAEKMEVAGVPDSLIEEFSSRRSSIEERLGRLVEEYREAHGRSPSKRTRMRLAQQATLETRQAKQHVGLGERVAQWRAQSPVRYTLDGVRADNAGAEGGGGGGAVDVGALAGATLEGLERRRSAWTLRHVQAEAARQVARATGGAGCSGELIDAVAARVLGDGRSVRLSAPKPSLGARLEMGGVSVYDHPDMWRYTSQSMVELEQRLLDAAEREAPAPATAEALEGARARLGARGLSLSGDQEAMVEAFALGGRALMTAVGPAGAGKTTGMRVAADAIGACGGRVVGVAPSAVAAQALADSIGVEAMTAQRWLAGGGWRSLGAGDVVIVDEAGMVDAHTLDAVVARALGAGAVVRMVGDPMQLGSVDAGGAFRLVHEASGGVELETIWRFTTPGEAEASLRLRGSGEDPFAWYVERGRVKGGAAEEITAEAFKAWTRDQDAGLEAILVANSTERVAQLNDMAQAWRKSEGEVFEAAAGPCTRDGHTVMLGDRVLTRRNAPRLAYGRGLFVKNGDLFTVTGVLDDGGLEVIAAGGAPLALPAEYVRDHVQLGYAATIHRSQGVTVDASHAVVDGTCPRESAYVALTRGRADNRLWVVCDDDAQSVGEVLDVIAGHVDHDVSAHHALAAHLAEEADPRHQRDIYLDIDSQADDARWRRRLARMGEQGILPAAFAAAPSSPRWRALLRRLGEAERAGVSPERLIERLLPGSGGAKDPAALLAWRIGDFLDGPGLAEHQEAVKAQYSFAALGERALAEQAAAADARADALARAAGIAGDIRPVSAGGREHPAWPDREYGALSGDEIRGRLAATHVAGEEAERAGEPQAYAHRARARALERELALRVAMGGAARAREDYQRAHIGQAEARQGGELLARRWEAAVTMRDRLRAEAGRRALAAGAPQAPDSLTQWTAPAGALVDPATPDDLRQALARQRSVLARAIDERGAAAAGEAWARGLEAPSGAGAGAWERDLGQVALWRDAHKTPQDAATPAPGEGRADEGTRGLIGRVEGARRAPGPEGAERGGGGRSLSSLGADLDRLMEARRRLARQRRADAPTPSAPPPPPAPGAPGPRADAPRRGHSLH